MRLKNKRATIHIPLLVVLTLILVAFTLFSFITSRGGNVSRVMGSSEVYLTYTDFSNKEFLLKNMAEQSFIETKSNSNAVDDEKFKQLFIDNFKTKVRAAVKELNWDNSFSVQTDRLNFQDVQINLGSSINSKKSLVLQFPLNYIKFYDTAHALKSLSYNKVFYFKIDF